MSIIQISKIQQRSGNLVDLPQLDEAEIGFASDEKKLFIGKTSGDVENVEVLTAYSDIAFSQIEGSQGTNLDISPDVQNGDVLTYNSSSNTWINSPPSFAIAGAFVYNQNTPSSTWIVVHNLDAQYVNVEPVDSTGNSYVGRYDYPIVNFTNANATTLTFNSAVTGWVAISAGGPMGATGLTGATGPSGGPTGATGLTGATGPASNILTVTTTAALGALANAINTSGKSAGLMVFNNTDKLIYVASGSAAGDLWYPSDGSTAITPA